MKGADRHRNMLDAVAELKGRVQVIVLCGRNERTKEATLRWAEAHPEVRVSVHGFTSEVGPLFQSADVVLTRGGSNTMAECVHFAVPALFHAERGAMPQEYCTRRFLTNRNIGFTLRSQRELKVVLQRWLDNPSEYAACIQKLSTLEGPKHPSILVDRLVDLGKEVS
jgi:UDP-N-acetylglucosamine:LPS N-acetylglucosamine transferase